METHSNIFAYLTLQLKMDCTDPVTYNYSSQVMPRVMFKIKISYNNSQRLNTFTVSNYINE